MLDKIAGAWWSEIRMLWRANIQLYFSFAKLQIMCLINTVLTLSIVMCICWPYLMDISCLT